MCKRVSERTKALGLRNKCQVSFGTGVSVYTMSLDQCLNCSMFSYQSNRIIKRHFFDFSVESILSLGFERKGAYRELRF